MAIASLPILIVVTGLIAHVSALQSSYRAHQTVHFVSSTLREAGLTRAEQALSSSFTFYDLPSQTRYDVLLWNLPREPRDADDLCRIAREARYDWLILEDTYGPSMFPFIRGMLDGSALDCEVVFRMEHFPSVSVLKVRRGAASWN